MNKKRKTQQIDLDLKSTIYFIFGIGLLFLWMTGNRILSLLSSETTLDYKILFSTIFMLSASLYAFYQSLFVIKTTEALLITLDIESNLIESMYQQFDDIDLTVFSQKYFESEDEVLNFILTEIPHWFINSDAEFIYDSIKEGYLEKSDEGYQITEHKKNSIKVFYICHDFELNLSKS